MIEFFVEGHPSADHRPRVTRYATYMRDEYMTWRELVGYTALQHVQKPRTDWLVLALHFYTVAWEKQDLDNLAKGVLEGLHNVLYYDDNQITSLHLFKSEPQYGEGVQVRAWGVLEFASAWQQSMVDLFALVQKEEVES